MRTEKEVRERFEEMREQFLLLIDLRDEMGKDPGKYEAEEWDELLSSIYQIKGELHALGYVLNDPTLRIQ